MSNFYNKPHATAIERITHLQSRGLIVTRPNVAARKIEEIGYERLRIYFLSRRDNTKPNKPFLPDINYNHILRLYECDNKLRSICFTDIGRFELVFRNRLSEALSARYGSHPYFESAAFKNSKQHNEALQKMLTVFAQSKDQRAKHYHKVYTSPSLPPIWMLKEFLTFGASARFYSALANPIRTEIASHFGIQSLSVFDSWIPCFVDLRNICAHHDRIFNRRFQKQPQNYRRQIIPITTEKASLKAISECIDYALKSAGLRSNLANKIETILNRYPEIQNSEAGF